MWSAEQQKEVWWVGTAARPLLHVADGVGTLSYQAARLSEEVREPRGGRAPTVHRLHPGEERRIMLTWGLQQQLVGGQEDSWANEAQARLSLLAQAHAVSIHHHPAAVVQQAQRAQWPILDLRGGRSQSQGDGPERRGPERRGAERRGAGRPRTSKAAHDLTGRCFCRPRPLVSRPSGSGVLGRLVAVASARLGAAREPPQPRPVHRDRLVHEALGHEAQELLTVSERGHVAEGHAHRSGRLAVHQVDAVSADVSGLEKEEQPLPPKERLGSQHVSCSCFSRLQVSPHLLIGDPQEGLTGARVAEAAGAHMDIVQRGHPVHLRRNQELF
ncbi:hypothetical protein EYF80_045230 [Liparis tanakae]|uniref:Uncharacterized protein n=1 Tax=Liparis tanakae TaxID=230148 RepID=A0A4Z2FTK7_9TELE|nr:hypothetical protein EYF80_045230 [Liparis tanakae]